VATLLRAGQILLRRSCCFQRWRRPCTPLKSCSDEGAASSGGDASTRRSNPALTQVPLPVVATLLRDAQILLGRRCRFQRWRRSYAPLKSCPDAGAASSGRGASTRRSNPARSQVPLPAVAALLRAAQILLWCRCRFMWLRRFYALLKSCSDAGAASSTRNASTRRLNPPLAQVPLPAVATLLRAAQILPGRRCPSKALVWQRGFKPFRHALRQPRARAPLPAFKALVWQRGS